MIRGGHAASKEEMVANGSFEKSPLSPPPLQQGLHWLSLMH